MRKVAITCHATAAEESFNEAALTPKSPRGRLERVCVYVMKLYGRSDRIQAHLTQNGDGVILREENDYMWLECRYLLVLVLSKRIGRAASPPGASSPLPLSSPVITDMQCACCFDPPNNSPQNIFLLAFTKPTSNFTYDLARHVASISNSELWLLPRMPANTYFRWLTCGRKIKSTLETREADCRHFTWPTTNSFRPDEKHALRWRHGLTRAKVPPSAA